MNLTEQFVTSVTPTVVAIDGKEFALRPMSAAAHDEFERRRNLDNWYGLSAYVVAHCLCEKDGQRVKVTEDLLQSIEQADCSLVNRLFTSAVEVSAIDGNGEKTVAKNSPSGDGS